jgi:hypothetical protein
MHVFTIDAWGEGESYISLACILKKCRFFVEHLKWSVKIDEMAPQPGAEQLEELPPLSLIGTVDLLGMLEPDLQVIDGSVIGYCRQDRPVLTIKAIDGCHWDFIIESDGMSREIQKLFPQAADITERYL